MSDQPVNPDGFWGALPTLTSVVEVVGSKLPPEPPSILALIRRLDELKARVAKLEAEVPRWIPVTERLPEKRGTYLVARGGWMWSADFYPPPNASWWDESGAHEFKAVTHWMPLPPAPEKMRTTCGQASAAPESGTDLSA
jgi:hypothetical protein